MKESSEEKRAIRNEVRSVLVDKLIEEYRLSSDEVGEVVELYYDAQELRIMHANKLRSEGEELPLKLWLGTWLERGEKLMRDKLKEWIESEAAPAEAKWAYAQAGIGPVIAAGLSAYIDVNKAKHVSSLWKFAGFAPGADRKVKGTKLAYCAPLKTLCWKLGESFVKVSGKPDAFYGKLWAQFKAREIERNESGRYKDAAAEVLRSKKMKEPEVIERLKSGKLTDGHLHQRSKRLAVKIFLSHYWVKAREARGLPVTDPYAIRILSHEGKIEPPEVAA
jgi:hypothetical protein